MRYDEVTGEYIASEDYPCSGPEFWVITKDNGPGGSPKACALFPTKAQALRWQLENGARNSTEILVL